MVGLFGLAKLKEELKFRAVKVLASRIEDIGQRLDQEGRAFAMLFS